MGMPNYQRRARIEVRLWQRRYPSVSTATKIYILCIKKLSELRDMLVEGVPQKLQSYGLRSNHVLASEEEVPGPVTTFLIYASPEAAQGEASTNQLAEQQGTPLYNLPWKIPCKLMNIEVKVEPDTDEVYAQLPYNGTVLIFPTKWCSQRCLSKCLASSTCSKTATIPAPCMTTSRADWLCTPGLLQAFR